MKKKLVMVLMAVMVATAALGGCGQKGADHRTAAYLQKKKKMWRSLPKNY